MGAPRLYTFNENYFENIDSREKAYWLGFIYADGFITKRKIGQGQNLLGLTLHEKQPLLDFSKCIETNKPIGEYKKICAFSNRPTIEYKLALISNKLVSDIEKWGVVERKTFKLSKIPNIDKNFIYDFIRGYFDGDGSVFLINGSPKILNHNVVVRYITLGITICGTCSFLNSIVENLPFLKNNTCLYKDTRKESDTWSIKFASNIRCKSFFDLIYSNNPTQFLSRKKDVFENYFKMFKQGDHKKIEKSFDKSSFLV